MQFGIKQYWKPTPRKVRLIADSLLAAVTFSASVMSLNGNVTIGTVLFVIGFVAKVVSNFFAQGNRIPRKRKPTIKK
jgi:uncharacterized membrane protein YczE